MPSDRIRTLIQQACLAPSSHNTQPWRFRASEAVIELWADRTRALPVNDPFDRELTISCGAALLSLRAAAAAAGLATTVERLPQGPDGDCLARVALGDGRPDAVLAGLAPALPRRRTWRKAFEDRPVDATLVSAVTAAAAQEGAALLSLDPTQRERAGALVAEGDRLQWDDPRWRRELALWMHPRRDGDGLSLPALAAPIAQAVVRSFDLGNGVAAKDEQLLLGSPWLTVLGTGRDDAEAWLRAGEALQRALLTGCRLGLQASYLNQPVEVAPLRERLRDLLGTRDQPQLLIRWGHPHGDLSAAPRRPLATVIEEGLG